MAANRLKQQLLERLEAEFDLVGGQGDPRIPTLWEQFAPLVNIRSGGRVIPFRPYAFQIDLIHQIERSPNTVVNKSRQMGISETLCSWLLMRALTEPGFSAVVFSKTQKDSSDLAGRIRDMAVSLGALCPPFEAESKLMMAFKGLGRMFFLPVTARAARGIPSVSAILFDEAAFIEGIEGVYQAAIPTMAMLGDRARVILNSTPNGRSGLFYQVWRKDDPNWTKAQLHYSLHPIYGADPDWAEKTKRDRQLTEAQWQQEFELNFSESDVNVFAEELIQAAIGGQFEPPGDRRSYLAGIDPAFGGSDFFCLTIWDITELPYQQVHQYRERRRTTEYNVQNALRILEEYNPLVAAVEQNSGGAIVAEALVAMGCCCPVEGVATTSMTKRLYTDRLVLLLEQGSLLIPEESALPEEMRNFRQDANGRREAATGYHDDVVMSAAIAFSQIDKYLPGELEFLSLGKRESYRMKW